MQLQDSIDFVLSLNTAYSILDIYLFSRKQELPKK